jgi:hypothetical protein
METKPRRLGTYTVRLNLRTSNVVATCKWCGVEKPLAWHDDTPPDEIALPLWGWLRGHADEHDE